MRNEEISIRFDQIEQRQSEFRETIDDMVVNQANGIGKINEIHTFLAGTEYDDDDGLVKNIKSIKNKVCKLDSNTAFAQWVQRNVVWSIALSVILIAIIAGALHVTGLLEIIKLLV